MRNQRICTHRVLALIVTSFFLPVVTSCGGDGSTKTSRDTTGGGTTVGGQTATGSSVAAGGQTAVGGANGTNATSGQKVTGDGTTGGQQAVGGAAAAGSSADPGSVLTFTVDTTRDNHAISPYIYCENTSTLAADEMAKLVQTNGLRLVRQGGNRYSAYNWETNASNAGSDYQFQNDAFLSASKTPGAAIEGSLSTADSGRTAMLITGQLADYVSADTNGDGDVTNTANYLSTRFKKNSYTKPGPFANPPDADDDSVYQDEFLNWVKVAHAQAKVIVSLDNEPDLWSTTHKEIWPTPPTYDNFLKREVDYAQMVKKLGGFDVLGFASFGWYGWRTFTGGYKAGDFLNYYLDQMKAAETAAGKRLIDYVDLHWYPEARGVATDVNTRVTTGGTSAAEVAARLQAPRSLWDASYVETSWIADTLKTEEPASQGAINLLPRLKQQIADHYPGTKLAIGEWNYGADTQITGGIATADVLGIFGREQVDMACNFWATPDGVFRDGAYQIYGNYDGKGSRFGDTSVLATAGDPVVSSIYAAKDAAKGDRLTLVVLNKAGANHVARIKVASAVQYKSAQVYLLSASAFDSYNKAAHPQLASSVTSSTANEFSVNLPAWSVAMVIPYTDATAPAGEAWPAPAVVTESGWTFDKDVEGWRLDAQDPTTLGSTLGWNATEGKPKSGALEVQCPFSDRKQQAQITLGNQQLDLSGKKLQVNVRRKGAFDGGLMFFAGSAKSTSWVMAGWSMLSSEEWTTIVLDPVAAQAKNPDFDPTAVTYLGVIFATGDAGSLTPAPVTFYVDQVAVVSTK